MLKKLALKLLSVCASLLKYSYTLKRKLGRNHILNLEISAKRGQFGSIKIPVYPKFLEYFELVRMFFEDK